MDALTRDINDLRSFGYDIPKPELAKMDVGQLKEKRDEFETKLRKLKERHVNYMMRPEFPVLKIATAIFEDEISNRYESLGKPVRDGCYYRNVVLEEGRISGERAIIIDSKPVTRWQKFDAPIVVEKARVALFEDDDGEVYDTIYMQLADGFEDFYERKSFKHISKSTNEALKRIENYCDSLYESWPWEYAAPLNTVRLMERKHEMEVKKMKHLSEAREIVVDDATRYELVDELNGMMQRVESMVDDLSKISTSIITTATNLPDDVTDQVRSNLDDPIGQTVNAISELKQSIDGLISFVLGEDEPSDTADMDDLDTDLDDEGLDKIDTSQAFDDDDADDDYEFYDEVHLDADGKLEDYFPDDADEEDVEDDSLEGDVVVNTERPKKEIKGDEEDADEE